MDLDLTPTPLKPCPAVVWACWSADLEEWVWSERPVPREYAWPQFRFTMQQEADMTDGKGLI